MLPNPSPQPQDILDERIPFLARLKANLLLARCDVMARRDGIEILQAVDFAAIFSYIYKTFEEDILDRAPEEKREQQYARLQVALDILFRSHDTRLVLIPPYEEELRHHLHTMVTYEDHLKRARALPDAYLDRIERALFDAPLFRHFVAAASVSPSEGPAPPALIDAAVEAGKKYFPELYAVVRARTVGAVGLLKKLFDEGQLVRAGDLLQREALAFIEGQPEAADTTRASDQGYKNPDEIDPWRLEIRKYRGSGRTYQTYTDAAACSYLVRANRYLNARKHMMILITPSNHLKQATQSKPLEVEANSRQFSAVRDLDYFLVRSWGDTLESFDEPLRVVTDLEEQYGNVQSGDTAAAQVLQETNERWKEIRKLQLVLDRSKVSYDEGVDRKRVYADFLHALAVLVGVVREDERPFRDAVNGLTRESQRFLPIPVRVFPEADNSVEIEFQGLPAEMPVTIRFDDKKVVELAAFLREAERLRGKEFKAIRERIEHLAAATDSTPEQLLLAGYLFAMEARWEEAKVVLHRVRATAGRPTSTAAIESDFLLGMIHRKLFEAEEAINHLREPFLRKGEPRFKIEYANALWLYWHEVDRRDSPHNLDEAITILETLQSNSDLEGRQTGLAVQIANLLAFLYTEKMAMPTGDWLSYQHSAALELERLTKLMPNDWLARFHDTQGYFRLLSAGRSNDNQVAASLLELAVRDFDRALADTQIVSKKRALIERHRNEARDSLSALRARVGSPPS